MPDTTSTNGGRLADAWARYDEWALRRMERDGTPGLTLAVTDRVDTLRVAGFGLADLEAKTPVGPDTLFEIGSIGKSFTALVLLRLRERGRLDFDRPVTDYLPWFAVRSDHPAITIHHLLTHTAGIVGGTDLAINGRYEVAALGETEVSGPPGAHFRYSNVGYKALGFLLEDLLGRSYGEIVTEELLRPLGMDATVVPITDAARRRTAVGYGALHGDRPRLMRRGLAPLPWLECGTADGSLASTPGDMARYLRMLLNKGDAPAGRIMTEESFDLMAAPHAERPWKQETWGYGYGLLSSELNGRRLLGHGGGMVGYYSTLLIDRDAQLGAFTSINGPGDPFALAEQALHVARTALLGGEPHDLPAIPEPGVVENAGQLAGEYEGESGRVRLTEIACGLRFERGELTLPLEPRDEGHFALDHPAYDRFLFGTVRDGDAVVALTHGGEWFGRVGASHAPVPDAPAEWSADTGYYRCWNPWATPFRIVLRRGSLVLIHSYGEEEPLEPLADGRFRIGESPSPERLAFDTVVAGEAQRVVMDGLAFYRQPEFGSVDPVTPGD